MRLRCFRRENLIASLTLIAGAIWCHSDWPRLDQVKPGLSEVEEDDVLHERPFSASS